MKSKLLRLTKEHFTEYKTKKEPKENAARRFVVCKKNMRSVRKQAVNVLNVMLLYILNHVLVITKNKKKVLNSLFTLIADLLCELQEMRDIILNFPVFLFLILCNKF